MWYVDRERMFSFDPTETIVTNGDYAVSSTLEEAVLWRAKTLAADWDKIQSEKKALAEREAGVLRQAQADISQAVVQIVKQRVSDSSYVFEVTPKDIKRTLEKVQEIAANQKRMKACETPSAAYWYARDVDKGPRDDTRRAASRDAEYAYLYALEIDRGPRDDTRRAACKSVGSAYAYALNVDKGFHNDTWDTIKGDPAYCGAYLECLSVGS